MRRLFTLYPNKTQRLLEILVPLTSWFIITLPLWLSLWHPAMVAYLIITFDVYWFYKSVTLVLYAVRSFVIFAAHTAIDWQTKAKALPHYEDLWHVIIIPEYKEPLHILKRTLDNLANQHFPQKRMIIVLATEAKDSERIETAATLKIVWT